MTLKKQLITIFGALAFISLVGVGVTFWTFAQWQKSSEELRIHYSRNLLLEQIRSAMYQAFKEVPDAVTGDDPYSRTEFITYIKPAEADFNAWSELPSTKAEQKEFKVVKQAFDSLVLAAHHAFDLVEAGRKTEAQNFMESNLEDKNFAYFLQVTGTVAAADRKRSALVNNNVQKAQQRAQTILLIAGFGAVVLILLLSAYIVSDLFKPLKEVETALNNALSSNFRTRLDEDRNDEIGSIYKAFNKLVAVIDTKEKLLHKNSFGGIESATEAPGLSVEKANLALRLMNSNLYNEAQQLKNNLYQLEKEEAKEELLNKITELTKTVEQFTGQLFPAALNFTQTDIRQLLYEVLSRYHPEFAKRAISFEFEIAPEINYAFADKLKLSQALHLLIENAVNALPEVGGKLGIRARHDKNEEKVLIEIADSGNSGKAGVADLEGTGLHSANLKTVKAIMEQHSGNLQEIRHPENGNFIQISLPLTV